MKRWKVFTLLTVLAGLFLMAAWVEAQDMETAAIYNTGFQALGINDFGVYTVTNRMHLPNISFLQCQQVLGEMGYALKTQLPFADIFHLSNPDTIVIVWYDSHFLTRELIMINGRI